MVTECNGSDFEKKAVHRHDDGSWHYSDETWWCHDQGFGSREEAEAAVALYAESL